jgi:hypothetical protein
MSTYMYQRPFHPVAVPQFADVEMLHENLHRDHILLSPGSDRPYTTLDD